MTTTPAGWFPDPSSADQVRYWDGMRWTEHVTPLAAAPAGVMPPPAPATVKPKRRLPVWAWAAIGVVALFLMVLLAPIFALVSLVILITAIIALSKGTPTWLRLRSRKVAIAVTAASAVALLVTGGISGAAFSATPSDDTTSAIATAPAEVEVPVAEFAGETLAVADSSATVGQTALAVLATLEVKGGAAKTGYDREQFGQRWLDVDRNGCDTRNDTLARDLTDVERSGPCKIMSGTLADPFTGETIPFLRGQETSASVQIDHVVALSDAWQKGAQRLTEDQRATFANDPLNLLAVAGDANAQKGDGDAATWLPKNKAFRCEYVARQVSVKATYGLWITPAEHDAIADVLIDCPDEPALTSAYAAKATTREELVTELVVFGQTTVDDPALPVGQTQITTAGQNGERTLTYVIKIVDGKEVSRELASDVVTTPPISQVTAVGTYVAPSQPPVQQSSGCDGNYADACVPISSDVDCASGSGNGPAYFDGIARVVGSDIYDLDRDGDGYACEPS
ncbi:GmrSD restriction endonuclease domain-containing protein [Microbacterium sp. CFBP9034]|uniref:GmrSD restriction endonuclease domain-containing protein n=1 Tax=Microbacterium sp. CFBP9034 TaxID=3096540 RepID=UPI002A6B2410|nr:DUF1524 domain-containing protein [Microbacterium sp. CFBP9034]MDY0910477.1 G5 domain-containing protein [Microbacterium sp. CFBP9034]